MANVFIDESTMSAIGNAIRSKTGKSDLIIPSDMPSKILDIVTGGVSIPQMTISEMVADTACTNTEQVYQYLTPLINSTNLLTVFIKKDYPEVTPTINNQLLLVAQNPNDNTNVSNSKTTCVRYRNGSENLTIYNNNSYDCVINIGDEFYVIDFT